MFPSLNSVVSSIKGAAGALGGPAEPISLPNNFPYATKATNWVATIPYALSLSADDPSAAQEISGGGTLAGSTTFFFPINPESLSINTPFAATVTPTAGGIVEEHSGTVFHHITVSGTTGVTPSINFNTGQYIVNEASRPVADNTKIPADILGGFGRNTIDLANNLASTVIGSQMPVAKTSLSLTGYAAFHSLYKLLHRYHEAKRMGSTVKLLFINFKDGTQYQVLVRSFALKRDKSRPNLYNYSIEMTGWSLASSNDAVLPSSNVYSDQRLAQLGIKDGSTLKSELSNTIGGIKSTLRQASGLLNAVAGDLRF